MTVVSEGALCLKIHLSKYELKKYFTSYNKIKIENPNVKKTISELFNIAVNMSDFNVTGRRLIEVFPTVSGGCIFKFTSDPLPFQISKKPSKSAKILKTNNTKNNPYIFCFKDFESLITVIIQLYTTNHKKHYISSVFQIKSKYYLMIYIPVFDIKTMIFINEFSEYSTKGILAQSLLTEYGKTIIEKNAILTLGKCFYKTKL